MKEWWKSVPIFNGILYAFYTSFVMTAGWYMSGQQSRRKLLLLFVVLVLLLLASWPMVFRYGQKRLNIRKTEYPKRSAKMAFWIFALVSFLVFGAWYLAYYPGLFSPDSMVQMEQATSNTYSDWHPVLHTILAFKLPLLLSGGWIGAVVLAQIVWFSMAMGYAFSRLYQCVGIFFTGISFVWVVSNPITGNMLLYPWKDVMFAGFALLLITMAMRIVFTNGSWFEQRRNLYVFTVVFAVGTILRHNAILFTVPILIGCLLYCKRLRRKILLVLISVGLIIVVKGPLYSGLSVDQPDQRTVETVGLPMTVIGSTVASEPEKLDAEILDFAYQVATPEMWKNDYQCGNFNSLKWQANTNLEAIEEVPISHLLVMMGKCFAYAPFSASQGLLTLIGYVILPTWRFNWPNGMYLNTATVNIPVHGNGFLQLCLEKYVNIIGNCPLYYLFANIGLMTLVAALLVVLRCKVFCAREWKRIFIGGSILVHNWGTMLLLTGFDLRFFFVTIVVMPFVITILCAEQGEKSRGV